MWHQPNTDSERWTVTRSRVNPWRQLRLSLRDDQTMQYNPKPVRLEPIQNISHDSHPPLKSPVHPFPFAYRKRQSASGYPSPKQRKSRVDIVNRRRTAEPPQKKRQESVYHAKTMTNKCQLNRVQSQPNEALRI